MELRASLRQYLFPREFRIGAPVWQEDIRVQMQKIVELLRTPPADAPEKANVRLLADLATGLWRLRSKMVQPGTGQPLDSMTRAYRHFESVWDALTGEGVKVHDNTGEPFHRGRALLVRAFQPMPGLGREVIVETIKPTVYFKNDLIQKGEVIVGSPEEATHEPQ